MENVRLSHSHIESFIGDVVAVKLLSDCDLSEEDIVWSTSSDAVTIKCFSDEERFPFYDGVIITLAHIGEATVTASLGGESYELSVVVRDIERATDDDGMNYYIGDLHDHTCTIHTKDEFASRTEGRARDYIRLVKEEGLLDFTAISDHAEPLYAKEFFDNFFAAEEAYPELIVFPGCECDVTVMDEDRFGVPIKRSGEIVSLNVDDFTDCTSWDIFYEKVAKKPNPICILAHPQIVGYSQSGVWNFTLKKNNTPEMLHAVHLIEMGDGSTRESNILNEFIYSVALDNGFKVSTTCSSDSHGPIWGYHRFEGKTVIMAKNRTKEALIDAIQSRRVYATESGNIKLSYTVNGITAPATLSPADEYKFRVRISYFHQDNATVPTVCRVISDGGKTVKVIKNIDFSDFEFTVKDENASYFYLRFTDSKYRRTWSVPIWTGKVRALQKKQMLAPIDKSGFTAREVRHNLDANLLISNDPRSHWSSPYKNADIVIDMGAVHSVSALGHYPRIVSKEEAASIPRGIKSLLAQFPVEYTINASVDGIQYKICDVGLFRSFGGEEIIEFEPTEARYLKLTVNSNVAEYNGSPELSDIGLSIGELTVYKNA